MAKRSKAVNDLALSPGAAKQLATEAFLGFNSGLASIAKALTAELGSSSLSNIVDQLYEAEAAVKALKENIRTRLLAAVEEKGEVSTAAGSKTLEVNGWKIEARISATGYDDTAVEKLLRLKKMDPSKGMDATTSYKVNPTKLAMCGLTEKELSSCLKERKLVLQRPSRTEEEPERPPLGS